MEIPVAGGVLWGDDSGGDGPPLVLLHPGVGDSRIWDLVRPALTAHFRVIRYDVRAFGRSAPATVPYRTLDDLVAVLDHFRLARVHLAGVSMGGGAALGLALAHPGRVAGLVALCPGIPGYEWPDEPELEAEYERVVATGDEPAAMDFMLRLWAAGPPDPAVEDQLRSAALAWPNEGEFQQPDEPIFDRLGELTVPTVLMVGDLDRPPLVASNEQAAARIPGCRLVWMPGVDHLPPLRDPELVATTIIEHLRAIPLTA